MEELLKKYYEYFLKCNFQNNQRIDERSDFYKFYKIIIDEYDISKDGQMKEDLLDFFDFFDTSDPLGLRRPGFYSISRGEEESKRRFNRHSVASFEWFKSSPYMIRNSNFVYSIDRTDNNFCKVYMSVKPENYVKVIIKLQDFINQLYLNHSNEELGQCKFRNVPANDAIVLRFAKEEHYYEFLEYLDKNEELKKSIENPNPFMPRDSYGLTLVPDNGGSYNYFVTRMIWDYMFYCKENNLKASVDGITDFINNYDCSNDEIIRKNGEKIINDYKYILIGKLSSKTDEELLSTVFGEKENILKLK